jgi:hypothetical protein
MRRHLLSNTLFGIFFAASAACSAKASSDELRGSTVQHEEGDDDDNTGDDDDSTGDDDDNAGDDDDNTGDDDDFNDNTGDDDDNTGDDDDNTGDDDDNTGDDDDNTGDDDDNTGDDDDNSGDGDNTDKGEGEASFYDEGQETASGEPFDPNGLTAAHPTLPFGTNVRVTNTENNKSVVVRINDRGPFAAGRVLDLSRGAFEQIASPGDGVAHVTYQVVK